MTTTAASLARPKEIVDEYVRQGFSCIFLHPLSPYGFAGKTGLARKYTGEEWLDFYRTALDYIIKLNLDGTPFREEYSGLILRKMLMSYPNGLGFFDDWPTSFRDRGPGTKDPALP